MPRPPSTLVATATAWAALGLGVMVAAFSLPIDDFWLSLASAREIGRGAPLDRAVDLTWTPMIPGALNPQWGAQVVLGLPGTTWGALAINGLLIAAGLAVTAIRVRRGAGPAAGSVAMLLAVGVLAPHLLARAQSFSIALLPLALLLLERRPVPRWLPIAYGVLLAVWANLHGAFVIGQVAALAVLAAALVAGFREGRWADARLAGMTAAAALVAPVLNPAGPGLLAYAYAQPGLDVVRSISVEWQPSWPWVSVATLFWAFLALILAGRVARRGGAGVSELALGAALAILAIGAIRHIPWFVLAMAPLLARDVDAALVARPRLARAFGRVSGPGSAQRIALGLLILALIVAAQPARTALPQRIGRVTPDAPVALADALEARLAPGAQPARVLNEQVWGGYLAYRLGERIQTAMDGRLEVRDRATWSAYFALLRGEDQPAAALADAGVTWAALMPTRTRLITTLRSDGWSVVAQEPDGVLLQAP